VNIQVLKEWQQYQNNELLSIEMNIIQHIVKTKIN